MAVIGEIYVWIAGQTVKASTVNQTFATIKTSVNDLYAIVGDLANLTTTVKTSIVNAINELVTSIATKKSALSSPQSKTANYSIQNLEWILADSTSNTVDITLPTITLGTTKSVRISWTAGANAVTIKGTINGVTDYVIKTVNDSIDLEPISASAWRIV